MRITPRGEEVAEVVKVLESGEYDGPQDMARALITLVADFLWFRDWYVLGLRTDAGGSHAFGPFASEAEALTFGRQYEGALVPPQRWGVVKVHGMGHAAANARGGRAGGGFGYCATERCGCPPYAHAMEGTSRGKCVICKKCAKYQQSAAKKPVRKKAKAEVS